MNDLEVLEEQLVAEYDRLRARIAWLEQCVAWWKEVEVENVRLKAEIDQVRRHAAKYQGLARYYKEGQ